MQSLPDPMRDVLLRRVHLVLIINILGVFDVQMFDLAEQITLRNDTMHGLVFDALEQVTKVVGLYAIVQQRCGEVVPFLRVRVSSDSGIWHFGLH